MRYRFYLSNGQAVSVLCNSTANAAEAIEREFGVRVTYVELVD